MRQVCGSLIPMCETQRKLLAPHYVLTLAYAVTLRVTSEWKLFLSHSLSFCDSAFHVKLLFITSHKFIHVKGRITERERE